MRWGATAHDYGLPVRQANAGNPTGTLVVFIHGLGGGADRTWGNFPELIASDPAFRADYAFFDYLSFHRRILKRTPSLTELVRYLVDQIAATEYRKVILVGHSMGGNIARAMVRYVDTNFLPNNPKYIRVLGLLLLASPMLGSTYYLLHATKDGRYVAAYSEELGAIFRYFNKRVDPTIEASPTDRLKVPTFAAIALRDRVVRPMSSKELIPEGQIKRIDTTHKGIAKPKTRQSASYTWLISCVEQCINRKGKAQVAFDTDTNRIFSRYTFSSKHADWENKYFAACSAVEQNDGVGIINVTDSEGQVNVSICVNEDDEIITGLCNTLIQHELSAQSVNDAMSVYIGAVGTRHRTATEYVERISQPAKVGTARYFTGIPDAATLEGEISNWLRATHARKRQSLFRQPHYFMNSDFPSFNNMEE